MKARKSSHVRPSVSPSFSHNHFISHISYSLFLQHPTCLSLSLSFSFCLCLSRSNLLQLRIFSPSFFSSSRLSLFSTSSLPAPATLPSLLSRSLTHCFLLPQIKLYRGRIHGQPTPLRPPFPTSSHTATIILPPSLPTTPIFISLSIYIPPSSLLSSLSHTQNEQINDVAMLEREEITAVQDDESGW